VLGDVLEKSGHRTLRFALAKGVELGTPAAQRVLERLGDAGCTHELMRPRFVSIDVPPEVDETRIAAVLQDAAGQGILAWEWADPRPS